MTAGLLTFEAFVVGHANDMAATAARNFTTAAVPRFNPLFLRGSSGLGKTHLLRAIDADYAARRPSSTRIFFTADQLLIDHTKALQGGTDLDLRLQLRSAELLLIDNLECLRGRPAAQQLLLDSVTAVLAGGGRVALACDRAPHELEDFCPRLVSTVEAGLVVDLKPADFALAAAILEVDAAAAGATLSPDVIRYVAKQLGANVRLLRGAFNRLIAYAEADGREISLDYVMEVLGEVIRAHRRRISVDEIKGRVSNHFHIRVAEMVSARRSRDVARPRQVAMYLSKQLTPRSLPEIGRMFGGRDHTTVIHAIRQIEKLRGMDPELDSDVRRLERELQQ